MESYKERLTFPTEFRSENPERDYEKNNLGGVEVGYRRIRAALVGEDVKEFSEGSGLLTSQKKKLRETSRLDFSFPHFMLEYERNKDGIRNPAPWKIRFHGFDREIEAEVYHALRSNLELQAIRLEPVEREGVYVLVAE